MKNKEVSEETFRLIEIGNNMIEEVKKRLPYGAGNQQSCYQNTQTNAYSRANAAKSFHYWTDGGETKYADLVGGRASACQGGTCLEYASLVLMLLRDAELDDAIIVKRWNARLPESDSHAFVTIERRDLPGTRVVVDPWPLTAQTCLPEDYFIETPFWKEQSFEFAEKKPAYWEEKLDELAKTIVGKMERKTSGLDVSYCTQEDGGIYYFPPERGNEPSQVEFEAWLTKYSDLNVRGSLPETEEHAKEVVNRYAVPEKEDDSADD